jgi:N-acylneuraminate cytidylyltransferase
MIKVAALLPMKGISERVPGKNLKFFNGKPLYYWVLNTLLSSKKISTVYINTDCEKITQDVMYNFKERVCIINRPKELQGNYVSMNKIIEHDISKIDSVYFLQTHSTNPLLTKKSLENAIEKYFENLDEGKSDSLFTVTKVQKRFYTSDFKPLNHDPTMLVTQHLEPIFEENSCLYLFSRDSFFLANNRIGKNPAMFQISQHEAIDIDTPEDFAIAESIIKEA